MGKWTDSDIKTIWDNWVKKNGGDSAQTKDYCGAIIKFSDFGNRGSKYGWEIDHITPMSMGGTDDFSNLRPLHFMNNLFKGNGHIKQIDKVYSKGTTNYIMRDGKSEVFEPGK